MRKQKNKITGKNNILIFHNEINFLDFAILAYILTDSINIYLKI